MSKTLIYKIIYIMYITIFYRYFARKNLNMVEIDKLFYLQNKTLFK